MESRFINPKAAPRTFKREVLLIFAEELVELADALRREGWQVGPCTSAEAAELLATSKLARRHGILPSSPARLATSGIRPVLLALHAAVQASKCLRFGLREMQLGYSHANHECLHQAITATLNRLILKIDSQALVHLVNAKNKKLAS